MPLAEPRTAFDPACRRPSNPAEESGSPLPSGKRQIGESRGEAAWRHPHQVKEWFAHIDDRKVDIMMSSLITRVTRRNVVVRQNSRKAVSLVRVAMLQAHSTRYSFQTPFGFWRGTASNVPVLGPFLYPMAARIGLLSSVVFTATHWIQTKTVALFPRMASH